MAGRLRDFDAVAPAAYAAGWMLAVRAMLVAALILALLGANPQSIHRDATSVLSAQPVAISAATAAKGSRLDLPPERTLPPAALPPEPSLPTDPRVHGISAETPIETASPGPVDHSHRARAPPSTPKST